MSFSQIKNNEIVAVTGDEIAVKAGACKFAYARSEPIFGMQCFANELGIVPVLALLQDVLPTGRSSLQFADVYWGNRLQEQFMLYPQLESLFFKFNKKLEVSCVIDDSADSNDEEESSFIERDAEVRTRDLRWEPGIVAVLAGPSAFIDKISRDLKARGYPQDALMVL